MKKRILAIFIMTLIFISSLQTITVFATNNSPQYEMAIFPANVMNISQGVDGKYSHLAGAAIDLAGDFEISAPFTGTIKKIYPGCNTVWLESNSKVIWADGRVDYMTVSFTHDNSVSNLYVGKVIHQGEVFYQPGTKGKATGPHVHLEVGAGKFYGSGWTNIPVNGVDQWRINHYVHPARAFFLTPKTKIVNSLGYHWIAFTGVSSLTPGSVSIKRIDKVKEEVVLINKTNKFVDLKGIKLISSRDTSYFILPSFILAPGRTVTVGRYKTLSWGSAYRLNNTQTDHVWLEYANACFTYYDR